MTPPFSPLSRDEQLRLALPLLLAARPDVVAGRRTPLEAVADGTLAGWYARQALQSFAGLDLARWCASTLKSDQTRIYDRAIRMARAAFGHRGGWVVATVTP